jgi:DNA-binding GntR family transcriptional regulator
MVKQTIFSDKQRGLLDYLIEKAKNPLSEIPTIQKISSELGVSTACLREQMELAKNLGIISTQPRKGIEILPYQFKPAVEKSLYYAINIDLAYFHQFSEMRNHLERAYFIESARLLDEKSIHELKTYVKQAKAKLEGYPVQIPHQEHRNYHLLFFKPLKNVFLMGFLESYWDMYEQVGLDLYNNLEYLINVWDYHRRIIEEIETGDFNGASQLLIAHMELIDKRGQIS